MLCMARMDFVSKARVVGRGIVRRMKVLLLWESNPGQLLKRGRPSRQGKHLDCALMNLFDKSSVHRYSVRPRTSTQLGNPSPIHADYSSSQKKAISQNSNLHSPLLKTNKFQVCRQISGVARRANPLDKKCANHAKRILTTQTSQQTETQKLICFHNSKCTSNANVFLQDSDSRSLYL